MVVLCLRDNVRSDAVETVNVLRKAGIQVVMVTGDAEETAVAIAKEAGIIEDEKTELALTHDEMEQMTDDELKEVSLSSVPAYASAAAKPHSPFS